LISEWRKQRDRGALEALSQKRGREPADPAAREAARLRAENARLEAELAKARRVKRGDHGHFGSVRLDGVVSRGGRAGRV
jgi:hypothetical protein